MRNRRFSVVNKKSFSSCEEALVLIYAAQPMWRTSLSPFSPWWIPSLLAGILSRNRKIKIPSTVWQRKLPNTSSTTQHILHNYGYGYFKQFIAHIYAYTHTLHSQLFTLRSKRRKKKLKIYDIKTHTYIANLEGRPAPIEPHPRRAPLMVRRAYGLIKHRGHCFCW
jgi:hypothetical protein